MLGLNLLGNAVRQLAENLTALAGTVAEVNAGVRGRLALDQDGAAPQVVHVPPALTGPDPDGDNDDVAGTLAGNGRKARKARV